MSIKKIIVITGPTASGKTKISIELANILKSDVISADSKQIYKFMNIGTSKPNDTELNKIKYHMINLIEPDKNFSVAQFQKQSYEILDKLYKKDANIIPIVCGGTGFYINALLYKNDFSVHHDEEIIKKINKLSNKTLHEKLSKIDKESSVLIHENNRVKLIRALEFFYITNQKISTHNKIQKEKKLYFKTLFFILNPERDILYKKINSRVDEMIKSGLIQETKLLLSKYKNLVYIKKTIGYAEIIDYLEKKIDINSAIELIKKNTRHYAKRQITWIKHQVNIKNKIYINDINDIKDILNIMSKDK